MDQDRDYAEEAANRAEMIREGREEALAEMQAKLLPRYFVQLDDPTDTELPEIYVATSQELACEWVRDHGTEALTVFMVGPNGLEPVMLTEYYGGSDDLFRYYELYVTAQSGADVERIAWDTPLFANA
jgi:hypothetical protein